MADKKMSTSLIFAEWNIFHLVSAEPDDCAGEDHIPALWHSHVLHSAYEVRPQPPRVHLVACTSHNVIVCLLKILL